MSNLQEFLVVPPPSGGAGDCTSAYNHKHTALQYYPSYTPGMFSL